jgi:hypothetical protein
VYGAAARTGAARATRTYTVGAAKVVEVAEPTDRINADEAATADGRARAGQRGTQLERRAFLGVAHAVMVLIVARIGGTSVRVGANAVVVQVVVGVVRANADTWIC